MRVLFLMPNYQAYSEAWMGRMMEALGPALALVAAGDTGGASRTESGHPVFEINRLSRGRNFLSKKGKGHWAYRQAELLQRIQADGITHILCHYANFALDFSWLWAHTDVPVFVHVHGFDVSFDLRDYESGAPIHPADYAHRLAQLSKRVVFIANSEHCSRRMQEAGIPGDRIVVKYLGVDPAPEPKTHTDHQPLQILSVGRFIDAKAPDKTIRAFERACEMGLDAELTIVGKGPLLDECMNIARTMNRVNLPGVVSGEEVRRLMVDADIYTQHNEEGRRTRQVEAYGVTLIEAMCQGVPVVGTTSGGPDEIILDHETGLKVAPGDIEAHAQALFELGTNTDLRNAYGRAGWHRAKNLFSSEIESKRLREILATVRA